MRGAAMSLTAAASGFVVFLLSVSVIQSQDGWGVTYTSTEICALKGSTVDIRCTYSYPSRINGRDTKVEETFWFTKMNGMEFVDLQKDSEYSDRVQYHYENNDCTLRITDLRESDSAEYKFRFTTNQEDGKYTGSPGVTLSVKDLQVQVNRSEVYQSSIWAELKCHSRCRLPSHPSYVWYKNGQNIWGETSHSYSQYFHPADSYSCAVQGYEKSPSPPVLIQSQNVWGVTYTSTEICTFKGSTVDIGCTYRYPSRINGRDTKAEEKFWFTKINGNEFVDLKTDSEHSDRVQYHSGSNDCTLRITDLRESDSVEYKFRFITNQEGGSFTGSPGVTLSVTDLQVQVSRSGVYKSSYWVELKCHSSCHPGHLSYVWYKNGQIIQEKTILYSDYFHPADSYSCAVQGYEGFPSPQVYAPRVAPVSVSPSGEIVEGSSVTLTCSSDANPAATYTWHKRNGDQNLHSLSKEPQLVFRSIQSTDSGEYYCTAMNKLRSTSQYVSINVKYPPKLPSVSVSPSGEIVEGSTVTLTCSSDANPAANYTWHKENEDSPKAPGQNFTITDIRAEHSGKYYCEAQNRRGRHNNILHLTVVTGAGKLAAAGTITVVLLAVISFTVFLWIRKKRASKESSEPDQRLDNREQCQPDQGQEELDDLQYASVHFSNNQADSLYSNIRPARPRGHKEEEEEVTEYAAVKFNRGSSAPRTRGQETGEDPAALYSTVSRT